MSPLTRGPMFYMGIGSKARRSAEQGPRLRGCDRGDAHEARETMSTRCRPLPARTYLQARQALLRRPRATGDGDQHENPCSNCSVKEVPA